MTATGQGRRVLGAVCACSLSVALAAVAGCSTSAGPMLADSGSYAGETLVEQLRWVESELDHAIAASGVDALWEHPFTDYGVPWDSDPEHRREILGSLLPQHCGAGGQLVEHLVARNVPSPFTVAAMIRAAWERSGWVVTDLYDPPDPENPIFRADREDGAILGLDANAQGVILKAHTACSTHESVTDPIRHLDERDAFLEGIMARSATEGRG